MSAGHMTDRQRLSLEALVTGHVARRGRCSRDQLADAFRRDRLTPDASDAFLASMVQRGHLAGDHQRGYTLPAGQAAPPRLRRGNERHPKAAAALRGRPRKIAPPSCAWCRGRVGFGGACVDCGQLEVIR